jgi:hypothetical protein
VLTVGRSMGPVLAAAVTWRMIKSVKLDPSKSARVHSRPRLVLSPLPAGRSIIWSSGRCCLGARSGLRQSRELKFALATDVTDLSVVLAGLFALL